MNPLSFNTTTANSSPQLPGGFLMPTLAPTFAPTNLAVPTTPSFQAPAPAPAPVTVNVGGTSSSQSTAQPQVTAPVKSPQQQQIDANFSNRMSQNLSGTQPFTANTLSSGVTPKAVMTTQEKLLQDFLANQKTLQDQIATNMQPGSEEAGLRQRLNQQRTQSALNQEQALNSGETSSFAGGEAQRVGRTDAIKTAGLEAQVQTMQDGRANALSSLQVLINSNDKSISTQLEIQKLQNTVSSIDKNAEATFFNLQQSNPSVAYDYDSTKTPLENLSTFRSMLPKSSEFGAPNQISDNERALLSQFKGEQVVKDYTTILIKANSVNSILSKKLGGPGDLAIVFEFMKALDPTSVVREKEYDTASQSGNIFAGIYTRFNGYLKPEGGFLPEQVKQSFLSIVNSKLQEQEAAYSQIKSDYQSIAGRSGLNPENVVINYDRTKRNTSAATGTKVSQGENWNW